jgi:hypothetical protein
VKCDSNLKQIHGLGLLWVESAVRIHVKLIKTLTCISGVGFPPHYLHCLYH